jgi:hypothetical protein
MHLRCGAGANTIKNTEHPSVVTHYPGVISQASNLSLTGSVSSSGQKNFKLHDLDTYVGKANPEQWVTLYKIDV